MTTKREEIHTLKG